MCVCACVFVRVCVRVRVRVHLILEDQNAFEDIRRGGSVGRAVDFGQVVVGLDAGMQFFLHVEDRAPAPALRDAVLGPDLVVVRVRVRVRVRV